MDEIVICKYCGKLEFYGEMRWLNSKCECRDCYKSHREELDNKPYKWDDLNGNRPTLEDLFNSFSKEIQEFCKNFSGNEIENISSIDYDEETLKLIKFYLANKDKKLTYCAVNKEEIGTGKCNHLEH